METKTNTTKMTQRSTKKDTIMKMDLRLITTKRKVELRKAIMMSIKRDTKINMETISIIKMRKNMKRKLERRVDQSMVSLKFN